MSDTKQFPFVYRFTYPNAVGVKTYAGKKQFGNVTYLSKQHTEFTKDSLLDKMEAELRQEVGEVL